MNEEEKSVTVVGAFCMGLSLTGCGSDSSKESSQASTEAPTEAETSTVAAEASIPTEYVHLITDKEIEIGTPEAVDQATAEAEIKVQVDGADAAYEYLSWFDGMLNLRLAEAVARPGDGEDHRIDRREGRDSRICSFLYGRKSASQCIYSGAGE